ncbi:hypothetical protein BKA61DRAFT_581225 [Leptodontidium sp. MPI-SDFR-AT-0119]|nr:hypothetical protein BKA61DRAFT_581225 [Leptodontidium sp. MPI-SDFR-AT-0119]
MALLLSSHSESLKACYDALVKSLDTIALSARRSEDAIFIDDISLRVKLWGSNVRVGDGCLEWAEKLDPLRGPLLDIFHTFRDQCTRFEDATKGLPLKIASPGQDNPSTSTPRIEDTSLAKVKKDLLESVKSLASFVPALKAADAVPKSQRSASTSSKINERPLPKSAKSAWFLLRDLDTSSDDPQILGAIVSDFKDPFSDFFPRKGGQMERVLFDSFIQTSTKRDFSLSIPTAKSSSLNTAFSSLGLSQNYAQSTSVGLSPARLFSAARQEGQAQATIPVGAVVGSDIPVDLTASISAGKTFESSSSATLQFSGPPVVTTQFIVNIAEYFQRFQEEYYDALKEMLRRRRSCYLVVGVKKVHENGLGQTTKAVFPPPSTSEGFIFAIKYCKIRTRLFGRDIKLEDFNKGGLF